MSKKERINKFLREAVEIAKMSNDVEPNLEDNARLRQNYSLLHAEFTEFRVGSAQEAQFRFNRLEALNSAQVQEIIVLKNEAILMRKDNRRLLDERDVQRLAKEAWSTVCAKQKEVIAKLNSDLKADTVLLDAVIDKVRWLGAEVFGCWLFKQYEPDRGHGRESWWHYFELNKK